MAKKLKLRKFSIKVRTIGGATEFIKVEAFKQAEAIAAAEAMYPQQEVMAA